MAVPSPTARAAASPGTSRTGSHRRWCPGQNGGTTTFMYDPFGRQIQKSGPLGTTNYLYDGFVAQANLIEKVDSPENILARYTQGTFIDEPLAQLRGSTTSYYQQDAIGSVTALGCTTGTLANTYTYDSFDNITASVGTIANPFRYTGRHFDPEIGIYHYMARYYDQGADRFVSEDPMRFAAGYDFYSYVTNDPIIFVLPSGMKCCDPNAERADIERGADFARNAINTLESGGYITGATHVGGDTFCIVNTISLPNGQALPQPPSYDIDINTDKDKHPCLYECALKHELVHRRQCTKLLQESA